MSAMQASKTQALGFEERVSFVSGANKNEDYEDAKTPGELEGGALRAGGAPVYTSPEVLGLLSQYVAVGFMYGALPNLLYAVFTGYFQMSGAQFNSAKALVNVGWSLKAVIGMISDCLPIFGYRRKSYMMIGWTCCFICMLILALMDFGDEYYRDPRVADIVEENRTAEDLATINFNAPVKGGVVAIIFGLSSISYIIADVPADALVVEYAQREPLAVRGRMQSLVYTTRTVVSTISIGIIGFCMNSPRFTGNFSWDFGAHTIYWILMIPCGCMIPVTYFFVHDHKVARPNFGAYLRQMWTLLQKRAMWQIMLFNFFYNFLCQLSSTAAPYVMYNWAHVQNLNYQIQSLLGNFIFAAVIASIGKWGTHWNWRVVVVTTTLTTGIIDAIVMYCTIYDVVRNQWFYLGVPLAENLPQGVLFIVTTFMIVELAEIGNEGIVYGLLTNVSNLPGAVSPVIANQIYSGFKVSKELILEDSMATRNEVGYTYMIYYGGFFLSAFVSTILPSQKEALHELKRTGGNYPVVGGCVITFMISVLLYSLTCMTLSMFPSTSCLLIAGGDGCTTEA